MQILINGCSYPAGSGLENPNDCIDKIIANKINADVDNISVSGNSNYDIFLSTKLQLLKKSYDRIYVFWTSDPRYKFYPELDNYPQPFYINPTNTKEKIKQILTIASNEGFSMKHPEEVYNAILLLNHDWHWIMEIVKYVTILTENSSVRFINSICPWDKGFWQLFDDFAEREFIPSELTLYAQKLLNIQNRNDEQINKIFQKNIINQYRRIGNIQKDKWLNLEDSWTRNKIDLATDKLHPGPKSHQWMAQLILKDLNCKNIHNEL